MRQPFIELIPLRQAVRADGPCSLDVMIKITPPAGELNAARPALNLGLVLDRSGSMEASNKINFARDAAIFAVQQLMPSDRVSVTIFDDEVETIVKSTLAENKVRIVEAIRLVHPGGSTALHGGWREGGSQVCQHLLKGGLNRVLLLSDGLANVGEKDPDAIASDVARLAKEGASTSTMGLGDDYNEDLLEAMAQAGDGSYYYIESPQQLADIFQTELQGLMATFGSAVRLAIEPMEGVTVADVLNDFERTEDNELKLPNLADGMPTWVMVRLNVSAQTQERDLCRFRLTWEAPKQPARQELAFTLRLPAVSASIWESLAASVEVEERAALLLIARFKKQATLLLEQGNIDAAKQCLAEARQVLTAAPRTPEVEREAEALTQVEAYVRDGEYLKFRKTAKYHARQRRHSKPYA